MPKKRPANSKRGMTRGNAKPSMPKGNAKKKAAIPPEHLVYLERPEVLDLEIIDEIRDS